MPSFIKVDLKEVEELVGRLGSEKTAQRAQIAFTMEVNRRIGRYMPFRSGVMSGKKKIMVGPNEILVDVPYARYQYYGNVMVNARTGKGPRKIPDIGFRWPKGAILKATTRLLKYDLSKNDRAGPYWDKAMMQHEKEDILSSVRTELLTIIREG